MSDEQVIADGFRLLDGSILLTSEMEPPEVGTVLAFGDGDTLEFIDPAEEYHGVEEVKNACPSPPTDLVLATDVDPNAVEGELSRALISASWFAPVDNDDGSDLNDLQGFRVSWSSDGVNWDFAITDELSYGITWARGVPCFVSITAMDNQGNESEPLTGTITPAAEPAPPTVTGLVLSSNGTGILSGVWDPIIRGSLWGYEIELATSTNEWSSGGTPTYSGWSAVIPFACRSGQIPSWRYAVPQMNRWYKIRVRALCYGGVRSVGYATSLDIGCNGINEADLTNGTLVAGANTLRVTRDALVSYQDATHYALLGKSGGFYGLEVKGGAINLKSAGDALVMDSSGLALTTGGVVRASLTASGLALKGADINLSNGGQIICDSTDGNNQLKIDAVNGIRAMVGGVAVVRVNKSGIELGSATDGLWCMDSGGTFKAVRLSNLGLRVFENSGGTPIVTLDKNGLNVTKGTISGVTMKTSASGNVVTMTSDAYGGRLEFASGFSGNTAGVIRCEQPYSYSQPVLSFYSPSTVAEPNQAWLALVGGASAAEAVVTTVNFEVQGTAHMRGPFCLWSSGGAHYIRLQCSTAGILQKSLDGGSWTAV